MQTDDFMRLIAGRCSVRKYRPDPLPQDALDAILQAGHLAPTACNNQPQRVIVVTGEDALTRFRRCTECHFDAPAALIVCYDASRCWRRAYDGQSSGDIDAAIVTTHMMLAAWSLGIGSTWVMYFIPEAVRAEFNLPENVVPSAILTLGYPAPDAKPAASHTQFRDPAEIIVKDGF